MSGFTVLPSTGASTYVPATEMPPALYLRGDGNLVTATELTRGPWAHRVMHGGGITGILGWAVDRALERPDLVCTRFTVDILSGVLVEELAVRSIVRKEGTRTAVVDASLEYDGLQVARASSQWLLGSDTPDHATTELPPVPGDRADPDAHPVMEYPRPGFNADVVDIRVLEGSTEEEGPGRMWIRLAHPVMEGETPGSFQQLMVLADLGAAVGWEPAPSGASFINTDVSVHLVRRPSGEWFLFDSHVEHSTDGVACTRTTLSDEAGRLGWILQSQLEAPPEIAM